MRAALSLIVLLAACSPEIVSGAYLCGPEASCPDGQECNGEDNVCVLPGGAKPFGCGDKITEVEPNDVGAKAQKIAVPAEFAGQFQARGDIDVIAFDAKANEVYYVEVIAERDGSPADPYLVLDRVQKNDKGEETLNRITALDDDATNLLANVFDTKTDDVIYRFQVPADGEYRLSVRDRYFEVRYEELVDDPRHVMGQVLDHAQLDHSEPFLFEAFPPKLVNRNFKWQSLQPMEASDGFTDRRSFSDEDLPYLTEMTPLLRSLGYNWDTSGH